MSRRRRMAPVVALWVLAPWAAEGSWGGFALRDYPAVLLFLAPMYGGAVVLIREVVRRTGRGWPSIALLGAAFGVFMAGLVDQSVFNPHYLDDTEYAGLIRDSTATMIPGIGVSAGDALGFVGGHVVMSVCVPIAIVESFVGAERRREPWLGRVGLGVVAVLFVLGSLLIHTDAVKGFTAAPHQLGLAVGVVVAFVGAAFGARPGPDRDSSDRDSSDRLSPGRPDAPRAFWCAVVTAGAAASADLIPGWGGVVLHAGAILLAVVVIVRWSLRPGWDQRHVLAAASGPLVVAAAGAYLVPNYAPATPVEAVLGDVAITVVATGLLVGACWRLRRESRQAPVPAAAATG